MHNGYMTIDKSYGLSGEVYQRNIKIAQVGMVRIVHVDTLGLGYEVTCRSESINILKSILIETGS